MVLSSIDVQNTSYVDVEDDDVRKFIDNEEIPPKIADFILQTALTTQKVKGDVFVSSFCFMEINVVNNTKPTKKARRGELSRQNAQTERNKHNSMNIYQKQNFKMIIPVIESCHYTIFVVNVNAKNKEGYDIITIYTSKMDNSRCTRQTQNLTRREKDLLILLNKWLPLVLGRPENNENAIIKKIEKEAAPTTTNINFDLSLFALAGIIYLYVNGTLNMQSFDQYHMTDLRQHLSRSLPIENKREIFRLLGLNIVETVIFTDAQRPTARAEHVLKESKRSKNDDSKGSEGYAELMSHLKGNKNIMV